MTNHNADDWRRRYRLRLISDLDQYYAEAQTLRNFALLNHESEIEVEAVRAMRKLRRLVRKVEKRVKCPN